MNKFRNTQSGFTLVEVLVVIGIVGILAATALSNYTVWTGKSRNTVAQSDYRNLKTVLLDVLSNPDTPNRVTMRRVTGPGNLPAPFDFASISSDIQVSIVHRTRVRRNQLPQTTTTMSVQHLEGDKIYLYAENNGIVTEQITTKN